MAKYSQEVKDQAALLKGSGLSTAQVSRRLGVPCSTLRKWLDLSWKRRSHSDAHSEGVRDKAFELYRSGLSVAEVARKICLPYNTVWRWLSPKGQEEREKHLSGMREKYASDTNYRLSKLGATRPSRPDTPERVEKRRRARRLYKKRMRQQEKHLITNRLRSRTWSAIKSGQKSARTHELLGCSVSELIYKWKQQYGNHCLKDGLQVDHIRPCASFDLTIAEQQRVCFNWRNLQLLPAKENRSKGDQWTIEMEVEWIQRMRSMGFEGDLFLVFHDEEPSFEVH